MQKMDVNLIAPEVLRNPYPTLATLREEMPIYRIQHREFGGHPWLLTRYDDALALLNDDRFTKDASRIPGLAESRGGGTPNHALSRHLLSIDPPDHTRLRGLIHKAFTPKIVQKLSARVQEITNMLIDNMLAKGGGDFMVEFAVPLPVIVIAELLGVPHQDQDKFRAWTQAIVLGGSAGGNPALVAEAQREFGMYFHQKFAERRADPRDDLITALVQAEEAGDHMNAQELISMVFLLLIAGHETTVNLLANGTLALLQNPDQQQLLREQPDLMKTAVEEMLRYDGPIGVSTMRWAMEDMDYYGQPIRTGDMVVSSLLSADRDPAMFEHPDALDITRNPNKHLAFGNGIHYCVGAPLARLEGAIAFNTLLERLPDMALAIDPDEIEWSMTILLHGMKSLPVTV